MKYEYLRNTNIVKIKMYVCSTKTALISRSSPYFKSPCTMQKISRSSYIDQLPLRWRSFKYNSHTISEHQMSTVIRSAQSRPNACPRAHQHTHRHPHTQRIFIYRISRAHDCITVECLCVPRAPCSYQWSY